MDTMIIELTKRCGGLVYIMPTLSTIPPETPECLSDDAGECTIAWLDQLGDGISNSTSIANDQNNTNSFRELPDQTTSPLAQSTSWDPKCSRVFRLEPTKQVESTRQYVTVHFHS